MLPDRSCPRAAEDQTNLSKELSLTQGSKDNSSILTHHFNSTMVDEKHLQQESAVILAMGGIIDQIRFFLDVDMSLLHFQCLLF